MRNRYWLDGMMGLVVGDALGVPVEFMYAEDIRNRAKGPVVGMEGYGTFNMPSGTWSDDSSMALATLDSINTKKMIDSSNIMINFMKWYAKGEYTPFGSAFDMGSTCSSAIVAFSREADVNTCGQTGEYANGNGALMRIMPVCLYAYDQNKSNPEYTDSDAIKDIHMIASLTHNHLRSNMACGLYYFCVKAILNNKDSSSLQECLQKGIDEGLSFYGKDIANLTQMSYYGRLFHLDELISVTDTELRFSGYVVESLEAAIWSLIQTNSFEECLLKVVNYGDDSDTVGAIAGGLAGLYYGYESIPEDWLDAIQRREWIEQMALLNDNLPKVADIHIHAVPNVDDGANSMEVSMEMIRSSYQQGTRIMFLTSHSWGLAEDDNLEKYHRNVEELKRKCEKEFPDFQLYEGCEVLVYNDDIDDVIDLLDKGILPTLADSQYVLTELNYFDMELPEAIDCVKKIVDAGYIPVLAHVERYSRILKEVDNVKLLKDLGALVQINLYSIDEEKNEIPNLWAKEMLDDRLVDFVGTDAHRMVHRPPRIFNGVDALYDRYPKDYVDAILYNNVKQLILGLDF